MRFPRRRPCGVAINTLVDLTKSAGEAPGFVSHRIDLYRTYIYIVLYRTGYMPHRDPSACVISPRGIASCRHPSARTASFWLISRRVSLCGRAPPRFAAMCVGAHGARWALPGARRVGAGGLMDSAHMLCTIHRSTLFFIYITCCYIIQGPACGRWT